MMFPCPHPHLIELSPLRHAGNINVAADPDRGKLALSYAADDSAKCVDR